MGKQPYVQVGCCKIGELRAYGWMVEQKQRNASNRTIETHEQAGVGIKGSNISVQGI